VRTFVLLLENTSERTRTPQRRHVGEQLDLYYRNYLGSMQLELAL
jgi:hypothetical protein